ncbi:L,D-transpeptidase family protein [Streptomyces sp. NEAU-sy36]|uniref:L,D-transpeptidase family protein n=1 Tax=unclassified Streptomyces TaxID=2593676 RepID=UPI0015D5C9A6|nr:MULTISPECIES: L,D-transpeptidase family protein [unclassified Streptomyces]QLJ01346.1 L,D-transpeptidase family protein [Streptomyces sp. NEAU-sy36]
MRPGAVARLVSASLLGLLGAAPPRGAAPLPERLADTGGGTQLIIAQAPDTGSTTGTVTWWDRRGGTWARAGSAPARFGAKGLVEGAARTQGTDTTPTGLYDLPFGFGTKAAPGGTRVPYRAVRASSWWCQDNASSSYNRWTDPLPRDCRAAESEHLSAYAGQYAYALVVGFNYHRPVRGRGAGIFLHVDGRGATAGCVSVPEADMRRILRWVVPRRAPHIVLGTSGGATGVSRY